MSAKTITSENPAGLDGFAFVEFTADDPKMMGDMFEKMGFVAAARHEGLDLTLYRQGTIHFIVNGCGDQAQAFRAAHGPSANAMAFRVADADKAFAIAVERGAKPVDTAGSAFPDAKAVAGIGGSLLYLVDGDPFADWTDVDDWEERAAREGVGLEILDHLTHNVNRGQMRVWSGFYDDVFGFEEQKYFNIQGQATG
ncbi:MAG: 4-hydroxyphenylpyruvate dioxygenase, partial [Pseudomonadota bacterium]